MHVFSPKRMRFDTEMIESIEFMPSISTVDVTTAYFSTPLLEIVLCVLKPCFKLLQYLGFRYHNTLD